MPDDERYLKIVLDAVRVCAKYKPKIGLGRIRDDLELGEFQKLYQNDSFYRWFGPDSPMLYNKVTGGVTSIYRQVEIGCEKVIRETVQSSLQLLATDVWWDYQPATRHGANHTLRFAGRVPLDKIANIRKRTTIDQWMRDVADQLDIEERVFDALYGVVFEVRQGFMSNYFKRTHATRANASMAYTRGYLPCSVILSAQLDSNILSRYSAGKWVVLTGITGASNPLISTYDFMDRIIGYDMAGLFDRNQHTIQLEITRVWKTICDPT